MDRKRGRIESLLAFTGALALVAPLSLTPAPAAAQDGAAATPETDENRLPPGTWEKRCSQREEGQFCEISFGRFVTVGDRRVWLSRAGIFEIADKKDFFIFTPLGTALRRGVAFRIDAGEPQTADFSFCLQIQGCQAIRPIEGDLVSELKQGSKLQVQFTLGNQPPLITEVTLAGFTAAYDGAPSEILSAEGEPIEGGEAPAAGDKGDAPNP